MPPNQSNADILLRLLLEDKLSGEMDKTMSHLEERLKQAATSKDLDALEAEFKQLTDTINEATAAATAQANVLRGNAVLLTNQVSQARAKSAELARVASVVGQFSGIALGAGTGLTGGIFAEVNRYVKDAKEATNATRAWKVETDSLAKSRARIDEVLTREALPALKQAAGFANEAAGFIEKNPQIVQTALNTGKILIALGAVGLIASKGIKLAADVQYLASVPVQLQAARLQAEAAATQLAAAKLKAKDLGLSLPDKVVKGGGALLGLGAIPFAALLAGAAGSTFIGRSAANFGAKQFGTTPEKFWQDLADKFGVTIPRVKSLKEMLGFLGDSADQASQKVEDMSTQLQGSQHEQEIVDAFTQWKEDDKRLVQEAAANRIKIIEDAEKQIAAVTSRYEQQRVQINTRFDKSEADIIRNFNEESKKAEQDYAVQRADIIKNSGEEIRKIEEQHQENLRKLTLEHGDRVAELTAARDALGLVKEQRKFDRDVSESERAANREIAQHKRDTAIRLQDLADQFARERVQKQAQFIQALADNEVQRQEELKQAAAANEAELRQIRDQEAAKIRELQEGLNAERIRRREQFIAQIRDLDAAMLGERELRQKNYAIMLQQAQAFFDQYRALFPSGTGVNAGIVPVHDYSGYAYSGLYHMAKNGMPQFVLGGDATRAAERAIGGQLTERSMMNAIASGRGQITWNDHRRFDSRLSVEDRRAIMQDTKQMLLQEFSR